MFGPKRMDLEADKNYFLCTCKKSGKGLFCDGSHKGTDFEPKIFTVEKTKNYAMCGCKKSSRMPFCDGSHSD